MSPKSKIPATGITGFLGDGKTSAIRHLLQNARGRRIALIINEFGDLGVDGEILKGCGIAACREEDVVELANGCICCTVADDFLPTIQALLDRPQPPDHIVIETRSEEHTSELQSLMRISYAVFCLKKKKSYNYSTTNPTTY